MKRRFNKEISFRRTEVMAVTGATSNQLQYFERSGLITPHRYYELGRPVVAYTKNQMLQIKAIQKLREQISGQAVRKIISYLNAHGYDQSLYDKHLVIVGKEVFWVQPDWSNVCNEMATALRLASKRQKGVGQYTLLVIPPLIEAAQEIKKSAKKSKVIDFESFLSRFEAA